MKKVFWILPCLALALSAGDFTGKWSGTIDVEDAGSTTDVQAELVQKAERPLLFEKVWRLVHPHLTPHLCDSMHERFVQLLSLILQPELILILQIGLFHLASGCI